MAKYFAIQIDDFTEEVFHKLEEISDSGSNHRVVFEADNETIATDIIAERLRPFIKEKLYESNEDGYSSDFD